MKDYVLLIATENYTIQKDGDTRQELEDTVEKVLSDGFYRDSGEDGAMIRYTPMSRILLFDIFTKAQYEINMKLMAEHQAKMAEMQKKQHGGEGGNILTLPGAGF